MKNLLKQEKGVSLISLAAAIIILGIITSILVYSAKDTKHVEALTNMYTDIENFSILRDIWKNSSIRTRTNRYYEK